MVWPEYLAGPGNRRFQAHLLIFWPPYPFRWLPAALIPLALNLFSALCAALTLGLLARVGRLAATLIRTDAQRKREHQRLHLPDPAQCLAAAGPVAECWSAACK